MKNIKYKVTLSDSLLHFLRKENILGLFLYSVFLVETHKNYKMKVFFKICKIKKNKVYFFEIFTECHVIFRQT